MSRPLYLLVLCVIAQLTGAQELLAAAHGFPSLGELAGVVADEGELVDSVIVQAWQHPHNPANITSTLTGSWLLPSNYSGAPELQLFKKSTGRIFLQLSSSESTVAGVHYVEGDVALREGPYISQDDVVLKLLGMYVAEVGRLYARLQLVQPAVHAPLEMEDVQQHTADYRLALRQAANNLSQERPAGFLWRSPPTETAELRKTCEFALDARLYSIKEHGGMSSEADDTSEDAPPDGSSRHLLSASKHTSAPAAAQEAIMNGTLRSDNCHIAMSINASTFKVEVYYAKAVNYTLMLTTLSLLQVLLLIRQMEATATQALAAKVSLLSIGHQAIMDAYLCLLHLTTGIMVEPLFNAFATAAFFEFVIFAIFEMRYLLAIWRARRTASLDPWVVQRELSVLYARFYGALLGGLFLMYQLQRHTRVLLLLLHSFWVPQILYCVQAEARQPLWSPFVIGMTLTRLALPLYLFGCPHNLLRVPPNYGLCCLLIAYMAAQVAVLALQTKYGPRCFIPKRFLPAKYNYFRPATLRAAAMSGNAESPSGDIETGDAGAECVICMTPVDTERPRTRMVTPCGHFFHPTCLQRWMDVKMECPTCRRILPPL